MPEYMKLYELQYQAEVWMKLETIRTLQLVNYYLHLCHSVLSMDVTTILTITRSCVLF